MRRRRMLFTTAVVAGAVLLAASWFGWGKEGLTPVRPVSPGADDIDALYKFIGLFAALIFLSVAIPLALIIGRYRERGLPRSAEGPQVRGSTRLEILWTVIPFLIVLLISGVTLYKAPAIIDPARAADDADVEIHVEGRQFYWRYVYANGAIAIDRLRVPLDRVVDLAITAPENDVAHSFWAPSVMGKLDAIPGVVNHLKFRPTEPGVFEGKCGEFCGIQHAAMLLEVEVMPVDQFDRWVEQTREAQQPPGNRELGETLWQGVCTKCHFAAPEYAPSLAGNPTLGDAEAIRDIVTNGRGRMPAVGRGWTEAELDSLVAYLRTLAPPEQQSGG